MGIRLFQPYEYRQLYLTLRQHIHERISSPIAQNDVSATKLVYEWYSLNVESGNFAYPDEGIPRLDIQTFQAIMDYASKSKPYSSDIQLYKSLECLQSNIHEEATSNTDAAGTSENGLPSDFFLNRLSKCVESLRMSIEAKYAKPVGLLDEYHRCKWDIAADQALPVCRYMVTNIEHPDFPKLHRIRALINIGANVKAGDVGGYVEGTRNLSENANDTSWIYDNAIACGTSFVAGHSTLHGEAVAGDGVELRDRASMRDKSTACGKDISIIGASIRGCATVRGKAKIMSGDDGDIVWSPIIDGNARIHGEVIGNVHIDGDTTIFPGESLVNETDDIYQVTSGKREMLYMPEIASSRTILAEPPFQATR